MPNWRERWNALKLRWQYGPRTYPLVVLRHGETVDAQRNVLSAAARNEAQVAATAIRQRMGDNVRVVVYAYYPPRCVASAESLSTALGNQGNYAIYEEYWLGLLRTMPLARNTAVVIVSMLPTVEDMLSKVGVVSIKEAPHLQPYFLSMRRSPAGEVLLERHPDGVGSD